MGARASTQSVCIPATSEHLKHLSIILAMYLRKLSSRAFSDLFPAKDLLITSCSQQEPHGKRGGYVFNKAFILTQIYCTTLLCLASPSPVILLYLIRTITRAFSTPHTYPPSADYPETTGPGFIFIILCR